jgi:flagellin-like protein
LNKVPFKIFKAKKGISPILTALLLILVAVVAIALTCDWIMTGGGFAAADAGKQIHTQMLTLLVRIAP